MARSKYLIVVGGATASGKTGFAIRLAQYFKTAILSCDSRQFFREIPVGTAAPTAEELARAPHHFIGHLSITQNYSVGVFETEALALLEQLYQKNDVVILAGGSGLYQKALCEGLDQFPEVPLEIRQNIEAKLETAGIEALQQELKEKDPAYYEEVDLQNPHRLIRALSVIAVSGQPFSGFRTQQKAKRPFIPIYLWLQWDRQALYDRINQRVTMMMDDGLLEEAKAVLPYRSHTALQTVGYQELFRHFDGDLALDEAISLIQQNSRRYAKRQLTWSRRDGHWKHFHPTEWASCLAYLQLQLNRPFHIETRQDEHSIAITWRDEEQIFAQIKGLRTKDGTLFHLEQWPESAALLALYPYLLHEAVRSQYPAPVFAEFPQPIPDGGKAWPILMIPATLPERLAKRRANLATFPKNVLLVQLKIK
jgi:tRNA dimethylallyltransferase